jgi:hypothetical protein
MVIPRNQTPMLRSSRRRDTSVDLSWFPVLGRYGLTDLLILAWISVGGTYLQRSYNLIYPFLIGSVATNLRDFRVIIISECLLMAEVERGLKSAK